MGSVQMMAMILAKRSVASARGRSSWRRSAAKVFGRRSGDPAVIVAASDKIRRFELPLPLGSAISATFEVVRYRMLSSQENIWDTEQREQ